MDWNTARYDPNYEEKIDTEVLPLCDALNAAGFTTTASCSGHGRNWPSVYFEHSTDERIESLARFVLARESEDYRPFFSIFQKEIRISDYAWSLAIHLNNVYRDTPIDVGMKEAEHAIGMITSAIEAWRTLESSR